ncbi:MAG: hypothetical protein AB7F53_01280, partial [Nitrososphaeraceae archaeon]
MNPLVYNVSPILLFILLYLFFQINYSSIYHIAFANNDDIDLDRDSKDDDEDDRDSKDDDEDDRDSKDDDEDDRDSKDDDEDD